MTLNSWCWDIPPKDVQEEKPLTWRLHLQTMISLVSMFQGRTRKKSAHGIMLQMLSKLVAIFGGLNKSHSNQGGQYFLAKECQLWKLFFPDFSQLFGQNFGVKVGVKPDFFGVLLQIYYQIFFRFSKSAPKFSKNFGKQFPHTSTNEKQPQIEICKFFSYVQLDSIILMPGSEFYNSKAH